MLRKSIFIGAVVGLSAAVPILHQSNPELLAGLIMGSQEDAGGEKGVMLSMARPTMPAHGSGISGRTVALRADQRGHYAADFRLNGRLVEDALVDTGATLVAINRSTARRIGLTLSEADFRYEVDTANGRARAATATIDRLEIDRISVGPVQAVVLDDAALSGTLIGMSFLRELRRFGVEAGTLVLEQ
jgi:aspartyl protease family protein